MVHAMVGLVARLSIRLALHHRRYVLIKTAVDGFHYRTYSCVPLLGMVGYGASVWDPLPTYPPGITEHGAPGGSDLPPQNYGTWCRESAELQQESGEISKFSEHDRARRGTYPPRITEHGAAGGTDLPPRNRGTEAP